MFDFGHGKSFSVERICFRAAVNPSLDAADKTSCFVRPGKQTSLHWRCARRYFTFVSVIDG
jgi:hypothetical protein